LPASEPFAPFDALEPFAPFETSLPLLSEGDEDELANLSEPSLFLSEAELLPPLLL